MSDGRTLFIAWLPGDTHEDDVKSIFRRYGPITSCKMRSGAFEINPSSQATFPSFAGGNFRYAYITYEDQRDAEVRENSTFLERGILLFRTRRKRSRAAIFGEIEFLSNGTEDKVVDR